MTPPAWQTLCSQTILDLPLWFREIILLPDIAILSMATSDLFSDFFEEYRE